MIKLKDFIELLNFIDMDIYLYSPRIVSKLLYRYRGNIEEIERIDDYEVECVTIDDSYKRVFNVFVNELSDKTR